MKPSPGFSVPLKPQPGGKSLLLVTLVVVLVGKCSASVVGGNFVSMPLILPLLGTLAATPTRARLHAEGRVTAKESGTSAGGQKVG